MDKSSQADKTILYEASCFVEVPGKADREVTCTVTDDHLILPQAHEVSLSKISDVEVIIDAMKFTCASAIKGVPVYDILLFTYVDENDKKQKASLKLSTDIAEEFRKTVVRLILMKSREWVEWTSKEVCGDSGLPENKTRKIHHGLTEIGVESCIAPEDNPGKRILHRQLKDSPEMIYIRQGPVHWIGILEGEFSLAGLLAFGWSYLTYRAITSFFSSDYVDYAVPDMRLQSLALPVQVHLNIRSKSVTANKSPRQAMWAGDDRGTGLISLLNGDERIKNQLIEYVKLTGSDFAVIIRTDEIDGFWTISVNTDEPPDKALWDALQLTADHLLTTPLP